VSFDVLQESDPVPYIKSDQLEIYGGFAVAEPRSNAESAKASIRQLHGGLVVPIVGGSMDRKERDVGHWPNRRSSIAAERAVTQIHLDYGGLGYGFGSSESYHYRKEE